MDKPKGKISFRVSWGTNYPCFQGMPFSQTPLPLMSGSDGAKKSGKHAHQCLEQAPSPLPQSADFVPLPD